MITLHTYRFPGDEVTLSVHECVTRATVLVRMEGDTDPFEEFSVILSAEQWRSLCAFDPFRDAEQPSGVLRAVSFNELEYGDVLEISQSRDGRTVQLVMRHNMCPDLDDGLAVALDRRQWSQLIALDLLDAGVRAQAAREPDSGDSPERSMSETECDETVH